MDNAGMAAALIAGALLATSVHAQDLRERSLEMEQRNLESDRREREKRRPELSRPVEKKRNARDCENARVSYQTSCGSPIAPKYRSPACRDAEIFIRQAC
jgi:hypothetical protein